VVLLAVGVQLKVDEALEVEELVLAVVRLLVVIACMNSRQKGNAKKKDRRI
jgi:hypothetical protein